MKNQQMSLELELTGDCELPSDDASNQTGSSARAPLLTKEPFLKYLLREALNFKVQATLFEIGLFHSILRAKSNLAHTMGLWCQQQQNLWHFINNHFI